MPLPDSHETEMIHLFRVNVSGHGYRVYSVSESLLVEALDSSTPIPAGYEDIADRLDDFLESHGGSSMAFRRDSSGTLVLGYACLLAACDEHGRKGLTFLHALIFEDPFTLPASILAALSSLSGPCIEGLTRDIEKLARGGLEPKEFLRSAAHAFKNRVQTFKPAALRFPTSKVPIGSIVHDCAGAYAVAWTSLALQQVHAAPPWKVFDVVSISGHVVTHVEPSTGREASASELLASRSSVEPSSGERAPVADRSTRSGHINSQGNLHGYKSTQTLLAQKEDTAAESKERRVQEPIGQIFLVCCFLLLLAIVLISGLTIKTRMDTKEMEGRLHHLESMRQPYESLKDEVARTLRNHETRIPALVQGELKRWEIDQRKPSGASGLSVADFLQIPLRKERPKPRDCDEAREQGRLAIHLEQKQARVYACSPNGWQILASQSK